MLKNKHKKIVKILPIDLIFIISEYANFIPVNKALHRHKLDNHTYNLCIKFSRDFYDKKISLDAANICLNLVNQRDIVDVFYFR